MDSESIELITSRVGGAGPHSAPLPDVPALEAPLPDAPAPGVPTGAAEAAGAALAGLPSVYFSHGYEAGYRRAVQDLLGDLFVWSEQYLRRQNGRADAVRKVLYPFERFLEERINRMGPETGYVEGGLGI